MMNKPCLWLVVWLLANSVHAAKKPTTIADTVTPEYHQAVDFCLFHRFAEAERLLKQIVLQPKHPNFDAAILILLEEVYFWRGHYQQYVSFADSIGISSPNYAVAKLMTKQPVPETVLPADSTTIPFMLKKKGHIVVKVLVNGKLWKFMIDTGAQRTAISTRLASELQLPHLINITVVNSLGQSLPSPISLLNSAQLENLSVTNLPVSILSLWGFGIDGILGWDVLSRFCFTIDYQTKTLVLRQPIIKNTIIKNLLGGSRPLMALHNQAGTQLNLLLDSGSNDKVSFSPNGLNRIAPYELGRALGYQLGFGGKMRLGWEGTVKQINLKIDGRNFYLKNARIQRANEVIGGVIIDGIVGSRQFQKGKLTIDYRNNHFDYKEKKSPKPLKKS